MKTQYYQMHTLSDSRELLESKPYKASLYGTYIILLLIISMVLWMAFSEIDTTVKARAVVRPLDEIGSITATVSGRLIDIPAQDGSAVYKGQPLMVLDTYAQQRQFELYNSDLATKQETLKLKEKFIEALKQDKNLFQLGMSTLEDQYYYQYENDQYNRQQVKESINSMVLRLEEQKEIAKNYEALLTAHRTSASPNVDSAYKNEYSSFISQLVVLKETLTNAKQQYHNAKELFASKSISQNELKTFEANLTKAQSSLDVHLNNTISQWQKNSDSARTQIRVLESDISKLSPGTNSSGSIEDEQYVTQRMEVLNRELVTLKHEVALLEQQVESITLEIDKGRLNATLDGVLNYTHTYAAGDYINSGTLIARIIPVDQALYKVELQVHNRDISDINLGDHVNFRFDALPYKEYGMLSGTITRIGTDALLNEALNQSYYIVEAELKNQPMYSYKGTEAHIKIGMTLEAQVISETKNLLKWTLEKINLLD